MLEIQDIFVQYGESYRQKHKLSIGQHKAMNAIMNCRTDRIGGHLDVCPDCGFTKPSYNSCRNRHCPKCQTFAKEKWIENQKYDLLNVGYFHVVFTVPSELNPIIYQNQKVMYNLLFHVVAETLQELSADKKYLGATIGFTSVLHTWGQNLMFHPHIHCIVPAGGLTKDIKWQNTRKQFFLPIKVLSRKFRGKFLALIQQQKLEFKGGIANLENEPEFQDLLRLCYKKEWVVYCKPPFKTAACVVEYLGRYTHRVAISNNRILKLENGMVSFKWRDYKDGSKWKVMTVTAEEFIRRFLLHILPQRLMKIRHYGILGNRNKTKKLALCKVLTKTKLKPKEKASTLRLLQKLTGRDVSKCPACGSQRWGFHSYLSPPAA
jgi:hypothetical protein